MSGLPSSDLLLRVDGLGVSVDGRPLLRDISFELRPGECLTLLGESGAGKSLLAQAVMGNLSPGLQAQGSVTLGTNTTRAADPSARRARWGRDLTLLPQEPALSLDPLMRIGRQVAEVHRFVKGMTPHDARLAAAEDLRAAGLEAAAHRYPWQISGGMAQRVAAATALAGGAPVVMVDEPTKGLDEVWRDRMVATLQEVRQRGGCVVVITHDLRVARALGGRLMVLRHGEVVEQGDGADVLAQPRHEFTRRLLAADPSRWPAVPRQALGDVVVEGSAIAKGFAGHAPLFVGLDVSLRRHERLVLRGGSGVGKSTLGNVLVGLLQPDHGTVHRSAGLPRWAFQKLYQDPQASFAPKVSLKRSLQDVAALHRLPWSGMTAMLADLRIDAGLLERRPAQVSGGELQRVSLARVLALRPALVFADEPTSRLDPITQQETIEVLLRATDASDAALLFVTHDTDLAASVATRTLSFPLDASAGATPEAA